MAGSEYFDHTTYPAQGAPGSSAAMRAEFDRVEDGFGKLPGLSGNAGKIAIIKADATGMEAIATVGVAGSVVLASGVLSAGVPATDKAVFAVATTGTGDVVRATDPTLVLTDTTINDASTSQHGYMKKLSGVSTDFMNGLGNWSSAPGQTTKRRVRTSNTILAGGDNSYLIDITSGTFTQTFSAAATLGDGWYCWLRNSGSGDITLDPDGAELIDGLTSYIMYPGEARLVQCNGSTLTSVVVTPFYRVWTASGTWTKPPGYSYLGMELWSGGCSGQRTNSGAAVSIGGPGGGCFPATFRMSDLSATETVTIGAGGAAVTGVAAGSTGGDTTFKTVTIKGATSTASGAVALNGVVLKVLSNDSDGFSAVQANAGDSINAVWGGSTAALDATENGGHTIYGGSVGGSLAAGGTIRSPGVSVLGGNGGAAVAASNGVDGAVPGGGGGATQTGTQSGAGARGEIRMWGIA